MDVLHDRNIALVKGRVPGMGGTAQLDGGAAQRGQYVRQSCHAPEWPRLVLVRVGVRIGVVPPAEHRAEPCTQDRQSMSAEESKHPDVSSAGP